LRFTDGLWKTKNCYTVKHVEQAYTIQCDEKGITVYGTTTKIVHRGQTLGGPVITLRYEAVKDGIIKAKLMHYLDKEESYFKLNEEEGYRGIIEETEEFVSLTAGNVSVRIEKGENFSVSYYEGEKLLTKHGWRSTSYIEESKRSVMMKAFEGAEEGFWEIPKGLGGTYVSQQLEIGVGEYIYGLGERFTPFVKNGQTIDCWNADGGTSSYQAYKNIPFYVSNKGYGVFVNHSENVSFEVGTENVSHVQFSVEGEKLEYLVIGGGGVKGVLRNYTDLTGKPALPPAWTFGLWLSTSFTTDYDEETVNHFIDGMKERDIPLEVFHFDCFWMKEFEWCNFKWDTRQFESPKEMLTRLKEKGLKICVWINPYIAMQSELFAEGEANGYFIKRKDGKVFQCDEWQPGMALVDFTNKDATLWYQSKLTELLDMGVDCFKTDFGERIPTQGMCYADGSDPIKMHNYYTYLYNEAVFGLLEGYFGKDKAAVFARSATVGGQSFPVHWGGDCSAKYTSMAESLRGGLSLALGGFGFWSHDIGGFEATATPDIYKRWAAFGLLSTHSRLHGNSSYRVPWNFDEEASKVLSHFAKLKGRLMPYLFSQAIQTANTGVPMMRPMVLEFEEDVVCHTLDLQYMLGESLLVAPIFNDQGEVNYYLPEGRWTNLLTGESVEGGRYYKQRFDYFGLPLMVRENTLLPMGGFKESVVYDYLKDSTIYAYDVKAEASCTLYNADGINKADVYVKREENQIEVSIKGALPGLKIVWIEQGQEKGTYRVEKDTCIQL
jgi:alpha-D-xyloside xylohydrolase